MTSKTSNTDVDFVSFDLNASFDEHDTPVFRKKSGVPIAPVEGDGRHSWPDANALAEIALLASRALRQLIECDEPTNLAEIVNFGLRYLEEGRTTITTLLERYPSTMILQERISGSQLSNRHAIELFLESSPSEVLHVFAQISTDMKREQATDDAEWFQLMAYAGCLVEIDRALEAMKFDSGMAITRAISAYKCYSLAQNFSERASIYSIAVSSVARKARLAGLQNDPKQTEKKFVRSCWLAWKINPKRYRSKAAFARDVLTKCEHLQSAKVIEDWCREWEESEPNASTAHLSG
jgi:hypothetical protein